MSLAITLGLIAGGVAVVVFAIWLGRRDARKLGASENRAKGLQDSVEKGKKHHERKSNAAGASNAALAKRLRKWQRK